MPQDSLCTNTFLHRLMATVEPLPKPAIRALLERYVSRWTMKDGTQVTIRPIRLEDEPLMVKFHESLSDRSVHLRYFSSFSLSARTAPERLLRVCFLDYDREMVLVADHNDPSSGTHEILGVGRLTKLRGTNDAEVAVLAPTDASSAGWGRNCCAGLSRSRETKNCIAWWLKYC